MLNLNTIKQTEFRLWAKNGNRLAYQTGALKSDPRIKVGFVSEKPVTKHTNEEIMLIYSLPKFDPNWVIVAEKTS
jgi:hypothetical protein